MLGRIVVIAIAALGACGHQAAAPPDAPSQTECTPEECGASCNPANPADCTGTTPVCSVKTGVENMCTGCVADAECPSGACLGDGSCADASAILWVTRDVTGGTCTAADKCTLATAVSLVDTTKTVIHLDPLGYTFASGFELDSSVTITGIGASIAIPNDTVFVVGGGGVKIDFLQLGGTPAAPAGEGIECTNASLTVRKVAVVYTNTIGINSSGCFVRIERSTLHDNKAGAVLVGGGGTFAIFDNMIYRNGDSVASDGGGVHLLGTVDPASRLEFNTIVDNQANSGGTGGVICDELGITAPNNVIARNSPTETVGACTYPTSIVQDTITGLAFVSPDVSPFDYHIGAGSTAVDQGTTASIVAVDFDSDVRPQGVAKDIGADEYKP